MTAEHGLYYDTEWDIDTSQQPQDASFGTIRFSVVDNQETRDKLPPLSVGQYCAGAAALPDDLLLHQAP